MTGWKYAQILTGYKDDGPEYFMAEIYCLGDDGAWDSFCAARFGTVAELQMAMNDVKRDGVNVWFYENGVFMWNWTNECGWWDWKRDDGNVD